VKLCVYAIMRDESPNVVAWAETTADADEVFVLDTGSQDDTPFLLKTAGIDHASAVFNPFRFDDARNTALALAPDADLYLRLDADERLPNGWRNHIEKAFDPSIARYSYRVHNNGGIWETIVRDDLHQRRGFRWKYPTHEILIGPPAQDDIPDLVIEHTSPPDRRAHHNTNLKVLQSATYEYPGDPRMAFYYARELWYTGDWDMARHHMTEFINLPNGWGPERCEAYRILAAIDYHPERWLWKAIGEAPDRREPWVDLTRHYLELGNDMAARLALGFAFERNDDSIYTTDPQAWGEPFTELLARVQAPA
jgi:glycosyltransferase involved in cell wall biosynthesis